jgi:hypothetical protein
MESSAVKDRDPRARLAIRRWDELRQERTQFEPDWNDIARLIRPQRGGFGMGEVGDRTLEKPLNSQPITSQQNFAANIFGTLNNPANTWMGLKFEDPDLNLFPATKEWLWHASRIVLNSFRPAVSPFYPATIQLYSDIASFGNGAQYDEIDVGRRRFMDVTVSLAEVVWDIDAYGEVSEIVRRFTLTAHAAVEMFAGRGALPPSIREKADKYEPHKYRFFHHIMRNPDRQPGRLGARGKAWLSRYACEEAECLISEKGYDEMPFDIARWEVETGFTAGTGPGFVALASARSVHLMDAATLRASQSAADPTKLVPDRDVWEMSGKIRPGSFIYGGVNANGQKMIHNLEAHGDIGLTIDQKREMMSAINDAFYGQLMNVQGRTGVTPLEAMEMQEERMRLMAPNLGRVQHEFLRPKIGRRFSMLMKAGMIPPPPKEAQGQPLDIEYQSAAALAQKSAEGAAIMRIFADISPLIQIKPRMADRLDDDALIEALHEARGAPPSILRSREEADALSRQRAEAQNQASMMQAMESGSTSVRNLAQAAQAAGMGAGGGGEAA